MSFQRSRSAIWGPQARSRPEEGSCHLLAMGPDGPEYRDQTGHPAVPQVERLVGMDAFTTAHLVGGGRDPAAGIGAVGPPRLPPS